MRRKTFARMNCSIARALELVGEWWTIIILREAFLGTRRFHDFQQNLGIARNIARLPLGVAAARAQVRADDDHPPALLGPRRPRTVGIPFTVEGFQSVHSQAGASSPPSNN